MEAFSFGSYNQAVVVIFSHMQCNVILEINFLAIATPYMNFLQSNDHNETTRALPNVKPF